MSNDTLTYVWIGVSGVQLFIDECEFPRLVDQILRSPEDRETLALRAVNGQEQLIYLDTRRIEALTLSTPGDRERLRTFEEESGEREPWQR